MPRVHVCTGSGPCAHLRGRAEPKARRQDGLCEVGERPAAKLVPVAAITRGLRITRAAALSQAAQHVRISILRRGALIDAARLLGVPVKNLVQ